jgi:hypothetical protein
MPREHGPDARRYAKTGSTRTVSIPFWSIAAGLLLAVGYAASPLTMWALAGSAALCVVAGRRLPGPERRQLAAILAIALGVRFAFVGATFLAAWTQHSDLSLGAFSGDEAYYLQRAIRTRDVLLGLARTRYDYFMMTDEYGRTSYLGLLTWLQMAVGPTPYGMRMVNAVLFTAGAALLFRMAYAAYGFLTATIGLVAILFLPSLFLSSVSMLKESVYFLASCAFVVCAVQIVRAQSVAGRMFAGVAGLIAAWIAGDLRQGGFALALAGIATAAAIYAIVSTRRYLVAAVAAVLLLAVVAWQREPARQLVLDQVTAAAKEHAGHVFTVGHSYKLMDEGFYKNPAASEGWTDLHLTEVQAARFLVRAAGSFVLTPLPWQMRSTSELLFLPVHLGWYVMLLLLPVGVVAGWRRDPWVTCVLVGLALPTAAAVALTNGNVGTLLRMRSLVIPQLVWLSALGLCALLDALASGRRLRTLAERPSS